MPKIIEFLVVQIVIVGTGANAGRRNDGGRKAQIPQGQESRDGQNDRAEGAKGLEAVDTFSDPRRATIWARCPSLERGNTEARSSASGPIMHKHQDARKRRHGNI